MSVLRKEKKGNFTVIDNAIFKDRTLSLKAKGLLCLMLSLPDGWNYSIAGLVKLSTDGESAVRSTLKELEASGYFRREQVRENGKIIDTEYVISETKNFDFPLVENQVVENQVVENPPQLNTKELNTKESITKSSSLRSEDIYRDLPENLTSALKDFEQMRKSIKKPIKSDRARKMLLNRLNDLAGDNVDLKVQMLDEAIFNNWQNVYLPKGEHNGERMGQVYDRTTEQNGRGVAGTTVGSGSGTQKGKVTFPRANFSLQEEDECEDRS